MTNPAEFICLQCGTAECRPWLSNCADYYLGLGYPVNYVECTACSLVQQWPIPENLADFYKDYPVHTRRTMLQQFARRVLQRQVYHIPSPDASRQVLLDYGCGDGVYMREMAGSYKSMLGFEPDVALVGRLAESLGVPVYSDADVMAGEWVSSVDIVTAHYVMEHVTDLHHTLQVFHKVLKPGGMLHITVPNIRSWEARLFGRKWHGLDAPRHISFPDLFIFETLAGQHGFENVTRATAIFPNTLAASICTLLTGRYHPFLFNLLIIPSWLVAAVAPSGTEIFQLRKKNKLTE
jgi:SAM-dependent methyltransferase